MKNLIAILFILLIPFLCFSQDEEEEKIDPKLTEIWDPEPEVVTSGTATAPPSDAIILFDGRDLSKWQHKNGSAPKWKLEDGCVTVVKKKGDIYSKQKFGDIQLHIEFRCPAKVKGKSQRRGKSGNRFRN